MDCREFLGRYSDYDDSLIPPIEVERFRAHMAACGSCARYDRVLRKGRMLARQIPAPRPSEDFVPRLTRRLWSELPRRHPAPGTATVAAVGATLLLVALSSLGLLARARTDSSTGELMRMALGEVVPGPTAPAAPAMPDRTGPPAFPVTGVAVPRAWPAERVDRGIASSYSPLVTGPPAYRVERERPSLTATTSRRRSLD
ncbi:MAG: hypothetical protein GWM90_28285, partial [Gemmatimonadetes bacterium]|nr:zf-HC2 domain-containing protein [Gemmatimonadota bacterium]NIQ58927.1 zf-HC2 domain-containing protein [Gemmatimonadota bacterium]NIU79112.1 hypothetical protein [Gammaproteobacteria bacterium]NIX47827.1 hypothetical protein [Gemmatimonadota bacterium]NIY12186.1 hypothetical protein [Gemmatimonadota bacterium]